MPGGGPKSTGVESRMLRSYIGRGDRPPVLMHSQEVPRLLLQSQESGNVRFRLLQCIFTLQDQILFYIDPKQKHWKRVAVPRHLQEQVLNENHSSGMGGHFSGRRMYGALVHQWWWEGMYADAFMFARNCPSCAIESGGGKLKHPRLHPIPVQRP